MLIKEISQEQTWDLRNKVMWPDKPIDFIKLADDNIGLHYGLFINNELISVVSCFINNGEMQFRKLATLQNKQGKGYGTRLLNYILDVARNKGVKRIWCNARVNKKAFYEKFGFIATGNSFTKAAVEFTIMELIIDDQLQ